MAIYGYVRVSSTDQNEDRQVIAMEKLQIPTERVFVDKQSGKDFHRPAYKSLMRRLRSGDVVYVKSIDRLGRNYEEIQNQWRFLTKDRGVDVVVIDMPLLDTRKGKDLMGTFLADVVLQLLAYVAQNERETIRKRQREGIAAARSRGIIFGRPVSKVPADFGAIVKQWRRGSLPLADALEQTRLKRATFYRRFREHRLGKSRGSVSKGTHFDKGPSATAAEA